MRYEFIHAEKANHSVTMLSRVLQVSRSGFYRWLQQPESHRRRRDAALSERIEHVYVASNKRYGSPRVHRELRNQGERVGRKRVERLMRENGFVARPTRRFRHTTDSSHEYPTAPNLLQRNFTATAPDQVWVADITYVPCATGFVYLAVILDLFSRRVVGWSVQSHLREELALEALHSALETRRPAPGLIHHSDRGCQYAATGYRDELARRGIHSSMSRAGDCWDNAPAESFFSTLEFELLRQQSFHGLFDARDALFEYIEIFYNRQRLHSSLGYQSPDAVEQMAA